MKIQVLYLLKKNLHIKWTHSVQTHVVRGLANYLIIKNCRSHTINLLIYSINTYGATLG